MRKRMILFGICLMFIMANLLMPPWGQVEGAQALSEQHDSQARSFDCNSVSEISATECNALVALHKATNGANWSNNEGWLTNSTPCTWTGVECDSKGHVSQLVLEQNQLIGPLPAELGDLAHLTWLQLNNNQLDGAIPPELGQLAQVTWLRLEDNQLSGNIPAELGNITALESLYLAGNPLSGTIPPELGKLANLRKLYLDSSNLKGSVPSELGNLTQLEFLIFSKTSLSGALPLSFTGLSNLSYFHFLDTTLCEPADSTFQAWINNVESVYSPDLLCEGSPLATSTATATSIPDGTTTPVPTNTPTTPASTSTPTTMPAVTPTIPPSTGAGLCDGLIVDKNPHPMTPLSKPDYLQAVIDPAFGTTIRRITDIEASVTGEQAVMKPMYNTVQAWNADESYLLLYQRSLGHQLFDGFSYQYIRNLDIFPADIEEVFWDFNDPDVLYYVEPYAINAQNPGQRLIRYSVSTDNKEIIRSFAKVCGDASVEGGNDVQMMSWDSDVIGLRCTNEPAQLFGYRISTDTLTPIITSGQGNNFTPWVAPQAAPSGNLYFLGDTVLDRNMNILRTLNMASPEHATLGQFRDGTDGLFTVAFAEGSAGGCGAGSLIAHDLSNGTCRTLVGQENGYPYPPSDTHMSALAHKNPGWVAVSGIGVANWGQTEQAGQEVLDNELLLVDSSPNGQACRVAHHRSYGDGGQFGYWSEPHVVISPSGTRLLFGSDWQGGSSVDTYVVELPSYTGAPPITPIAPNAHTLFLPLIIR